MATKSKKDERILQLAERRAGLLAESRAQESESDDACDRLGEKISRIERAIINTPAESLAGLLVKARIAAEEQIIALDDRLPSVSAAYRQSHRIFEDRLAFSIWADAERLAAKGGAS